MSFFKSKVKTAIRRILYIFGFQISKISPNQELSALNLIGKLNAKFALASDQIVAAEMVRTAAALKERNIRPNGQLLQDLWVLSKHGLGKGFFLDLGAGHPISISNTWLLQSQFEWSGVIVEPNPEFSLMHHQIRKNDNVEVIAKAVVADSRDLMEYINDGEFSGDPQFDLGANNTKHNLIRKNKASTYIPSINIGDLIREREIKEIDYLNLDIEGGELDILRAFPFEYCKVKLITVEHNYRPDAIAEISNFLHSKGYAQSFRNNSEWDLFFELI